MRCELAIYEHADNGLSLFVVPETEAERTILQGLWKHGQMRLVNGVADKSGQGFSVQWKMAEPDAVTEANRDAKENMNRREMIEAVAAACVGASATVEAVGSDKPPLLLAIQVDGNLSCHEAERVMRNMKPVEDQIAANLGHRIPIVLLMGGMKIEAIVDPRG